jgi:putative transposase
LIERDHDLSISRQCELLGLPRSSYYYLPRAESELNLRLMRRIDEVHLKYPFYGSRRMSIHLRDEELEVNRKRVQRLMRKMGLVAIYPGPRTTAAAPERRKYPYLLRNLAIEHPDQVWCADITYIPMRRGFLYLVAIMDWMSRYVLSWDLSNTLSHHFCVDSLERALGTSRPEIFNTDQGSQFTSDVFTSTLETNGVAISMDGKGRALDNVFIERLWRSLKYEEVYLHAYEDGFEAADGIGRYLEFYNTKRPHQSLGYRTPFQVYNSTPGLTA